MEIYALLLYKYKKNVFNFASQHLMSKIFTIWPFTRDLCHLLHYSNEPVVEI